jgi:alkanesulfonate monooxygenase SsuD/methylene tetrahydromethanopterin reductase-like flavin-dependent oxidoreductase (luciferase family)
VEAGVHLPIIDFAGEGLSHRRLADTVDAARECGFAALSVNDHFLFSAPWLDGLMALAAVVERSATMQLMTSLALVNLRGPVPLAKALIALDVLSDGRVIAGIGPGSSQADYEATGVAYADRWRLFDESALELKAMLASGNAVGDTSAPSSLPGPQPVQARGIPTWIGSWGSAAGLRRVACLGDGWIASAYNTTPERFSEAMGRLRDESQQRGPSSEVFPNALVTMWAWVTDKRSDAERVLTEVLTRLVRRGADELRGRLCIGSAEECAVLLSRYAAAGCQRVHFWPLGDERRQIELIAGEVMPQIGE